MSSLTDVAKAAGVSIATVSRVISHPDKVTEATQARVKRVMEELRYRPNRVARRLRQRGGKRHLLGLVIPDIQNPFFAELVRGVEDIAYANKFAVLLCNSDEDPVKEAFYIDVMRDESVDGIILPPAADHDVAVLEAAEAGIPVVIVDRSPPDSPFDRVEVDSREGAREAVAHLIAKGHRRIGLIAGPEPLSTSRERREGYEQALAAAGISPDPECIRVGDNKQPSGRILVEDLLGLARPPTALFISNNLMAVGALEALHKAGRRIPDQMAVIGFDDLPWAEALDPPLTMVRQPAYEVGRKAAELLLRRLEDRAAPAVAIRLKPRLIVRKSC